MVQSKAGLLTRIAGTIARACPARGSNAVTARLMGSLLPVAPSPIASGEGGDDQVEDWVRESGRTASSWTTFARAIS